MLNICNKNYEKWAQKFDLDYLKKVTFAHNIEVNQNYCTENMLTLKGMEYCEIKWKEDVINYDLEMLNEDYFSTSISSMEYCNKSILTYWDEQELKNLCIEKYENFLYKNDKILIDNVKFVRNIQENQKFCDEVINTGQGKIDCLNQYKSFLYQSDLKVVENSTFTKNFKINKDFCEIEIITPSGKENCLTKIKNYIIEIEEKIISGLNLIEISRIIMIYVVNCNY